MSNLPSVRHVACAMSCQSPLKACTLKCHKWNSMTTADLDAAGVELQTRALAIALKRAEDLEGALRQYLDAQPQCSCSDPSCKMEAARVRARALLVPLHTVGGSEPC